MKTPPAAQRPNCRRDRSDKMEESWSGKAVDVVLDGLGIFADSAIVALFVESTRQGSERLLVCSAKLEVSGLVLFVED
jgi:hypothetical protein